MNGIRGRGAARAVASGAGSFVRGRLVPIVVASALFMDLMDSAALAMAIPTLARYFRVEIVELKLALTAYLVTVAMLVPASGWMANRFGARRVFVSAMALFVAGSICCGLSETVPQLIVARILQGIGGSMMTPVGRSIVVASVERNELIRAMAWYTLPAIVAPLAGPPFAGLLIEVASWRWIFLINAPVGVLGIVAVLRFVPRLNPGPRARFDVAGFLLAAATILSIMGLVETSGLAGRPVGVRLLGVVAAIAVATLYVAQALRAREPIVDLRLLARHATMRLSLIATWIQRVALGGIMFLLPLQLQVALGFSPLVSSEVLVAAAIGSVVSRAVAPGGIRRHGFRGSMLRYGLVTALLACLPAAFGHKTPVLLMGAVMTAHAAIRASFFMAGNTLAFGDVEGAEIGHTSVLFAISQQLSLGFGINIAALLL